MGTKAKQKNIPDGWDSVLLRDIAINLDNKRIPLNSEERRSMQGTVPYCGANGVVDYINDYIFDEDIILVAEDGGQFEEYAHRPIAYRMTGKCWVNNHAHVIKAKKEVSQDMLFYLTVHKNILKYLNGGTRAKLNKSELMGIRYILPPLPEQKRIVAVLETWDRAINLLKRKIEIKKQIKKGLMQQLLTGKKRLPGFEGEWRNREIREALSYKQPAQHLVSSTEYSNEYQTPVLTPGKTFILGYTNENEGVYTDTPAIIFDDFTTASKYVDFNFKVKSSAIKILKAQKGFNPKFIFEKMQSLRVAMGGHKRRYLAEYQYLTIKVPQISEQDAIARRLMLADQEIKKLEEKLSILQDQKKYLLNNLISGAIRVPESIGEREVVEAK